MRVVLADIEEQALVEAGQRLRAHDAEVLLIQTDVSDPASVGNLADRIYERFGAVHLLCNNAGVVTAGLAWEQSLEDWRWLLGVDLWGSIHGIHAFVPKMLAGGEPGHIINTSSIAGLLAFGGIAAYDVAKAGVVALSKALYHDLKVVGSSIGVSVLCPGIVSSTQIGTSERNRPGGQHSTKDAPETEDTEPLPVSAMTPAQIAGRVFDAVRSEQFWIITHEAYYAPLTERVAGMIDGTTVIDVPATL